ncbi:hypothetical protein GALL_313260 [mine drainage metagenome]|uniref:Uncharacterized protein n=1 Tax=mine drainage metagenome TaxID=410659 RepID=A0A1J5QU15_9ZZZZ
MTTAAETREELEKVSSLVLAARRLLATGALVDLSVLRDRVGALCNAVQSMPREDGRSLAEQMLGLIRRLDGLAADLRDHMRSLNERHDGGRA